MTISIANTLITNTFEYWRSRTNELAYAMSSNTVTTGGSPAVGNAYVTGLFFANNLSSNTLSVTGNTILSNTLYVTGSATFSNTISVTGTATFSNTTTHTGASTFANTLGATGAVTFANTLAVTGNTSFGNVSISGSLVVTGNVYLGTTVVNSSYYTGTASNANNFGGLAPTSYVNTSVSYATAVSQDVSISGAYNSLTATLATTGVAAGGYGSSVNAISVVVDAKGRVTSISNSAINVNTALGYTPLSTTATYANAATQDVSIGGTFNSLTAVLATTGVGAATYGDTASFPIITVDAKGRLTSVTTQLINSAISTQSVNNALFLTGVSGNNFVQNTDSRTLSGNLVFSSPLEANGVTNAAIVIKGGLGVGNSIYANLATSIAFFNNVATVGLIVSSTIDPTTTSTGALRVSGGVGIAKSLYANATTATAYFNNVATLGVDVTSTVDSTSILTGSIITDGGVGIAKNLYANGTGTGAYFNNANVGGTLGVVGAATFSSTVSATGALTANGGTFNGVFANSTGQDVIISGTSSASLAANLVTMQGLTSGTYGNTSAIPTITVDTKGRINAISLSTVSIPAGTVNTSGNFTIAGNLAFSSTINANGITNAAITFAGGVGIAKNLYANGSGTGAYFNNANVGGALGVAGGLSVTSAVALSNTLTVVGATTIANTVLSTGSMELGAGGTGDRNCLIDFHSDDTYTDYSFRMLAGAGNNSIRQITARGTSGIQIQTEDAAPIYFSANNAEVVRITSAGLVGIGNTAPNAKLQVTGTANISGIVTLGSTLSLNGITLGNTAGSLDLNNSGITDYISAPAAKTASFTVANSESGSIYQCSNATVATLVTLPASAVTGFNATVIQSGAANVIVYAASGTLLKRTGVGANTSTANIGGQYGMATLLKLSTGWVIGGDVW